MPKRSKNSDREGAAHKRMKKDLDANDRLGRSFTTAELWGKLGYYVQREVFAYMDIRISNKCCRVNKSWKSQLVETKLFNKGIAFLDWRVEKPVEDKMKKRFGRAAFWPWPKFFQLGLSSVTHLVCIGKMIDVHYREKVFAGKKPLEKLTFWGSRFMDEEILRTATLLQGKRTLLQLMQCEVRWARHFSSFATGAALQSFTWWKWFSVSYLVFDETFKEIKNSDGYENHEKRKWLHTQYERSNLIWPYGEDQVEWLNASLKLFPSLDKDVLEAIKIHESGLFDWSWWLLADLKTLKVRNESSWSSNFATRDLTTLYCAFLGQLIASLPENKRPQGWTSPPFPFPADYKCDWSV